MVSGVSSSGVASGVAAGAASGVTTAGVVAGAAAEPVAVAGAKGRQGKKKGATNTAAGAEVVTKRALRIDPRPPDRFVQELVNPQYLFVVALLCRLHLDCYCCAQEPSSSKKRNKQPSKAVKQPKNGVKSAPYLLDDPVEPPPVLYLNRAKPTSSVLPFHGVKPISEPLAPNSFSGEESFYAGYQVSSLRPLT
jgi:hypothetical protein